MLQNDHINTNMIYEVDMVSFLRLRFSLALYASFNNKYMH